MHSNCFGMKILLSLVQATNSVFIIVKLFQKWNRSLILLRFTFWKSLLVQMHKKLSMYAIDMQVITLDLGERCIVRLRTFSALMLLCFGVIQSLFTSYIIAGTILVFSKFTLKNEPKQFASHWFRKKFYPVPSFIPQSLETKTWWSLI